MNPLTSSSAAPSVAAPAPSRRVVDAPMRMFHWLLTLSFTGAYLSADGERWRLLHVTLGYVMFGLLLCRLVYGLIGPRQARWTVLWAKLQSGRHSGIEWLRGVARVRGWADVQHLPWRQVQNGLMALALALLLGGIVPLTLTGYATFHEWGGDWLGELHEGVGEAYLLLVLAHLGGLLGLSVWRRSNLARPMLTGRIAGRGPDLATHNHTAWAVVLLLAVIAYIAWEWTQAPQGWLGGSVAVLFEKETT